MVDVGLSLTHHDQNYPDYSSGLRSKSRLLTRYYGSGITELDYGPGLRNTDPDNFGHDG